jgi:hypothetical protein
MVGVRSFPRAFPGNMGGILAQNATNDEVFLVGGLYTGSGSYPGPLRLRFPSSLAPQIQHLLAGDQIGVGAHIMGSPFRRDWDNPTYDLWWAVDYITSMSRPAP